MNHIVYTTMVFGKKSVIGLADEYRLVHFPGTDLITLTCGSELVASFTEDDFVMLAPLIAQFASQYQWHAGVDDQPPPTNRGVNPEVASGSELSPNAEGVNI